MCYIPKNVDYIDAGGPLDQYITGGILNNSCYHRFVGNLAKNTVIDPGMKNAFPVVSDRIVKRDEPYSILRVYKDIEDLIIGQTIPGGESLEMCPIPPAQPCLC